MLIKLEHLIVQQLFSILTLSERLYEGTESFTLAFLKRVNTNIPPKMLGFSHISDNTDKKSAVYLIKNRMVGGKKINDASRRQYSSRKHYVIFKHVTNLYRLLSGTGISLQ